MSSQIVRSRRHFVTVAAIVALAMSAVACDDDDPAPEVPEGGTGSAFNDAIIASDSHDEVLLGGGTGQMLVTVQCGADAGGSLVTVLAEGLEPGVYTGVIEPSTGVDVLIEATPSGQATGAAQMTLDAEEYTVTFADIEADGAEFTVRGCPS
jgi:hypothetical protein